MISPGNKPLLPTDSAYIQDFTTTQYHEILMLAKRNYTFARYQKIPVEVPFVLWRHDIDYSLNRAHRLAFIEIEEGITSTFFLNPHSEFYNVFEKSQANIVKELLEAGHDIGLHFDAAFYDISTEEQLDSLVHREALLLEQLFGVKPVAFSFHNPTKFLLTCEKDSYGGLLNCYSKRFKTEIPYCSDSNGYWRFRKLGDVLEQAKDSCLQVLTHPGWWQEQPMYPRQRIFRSAYGRAESTLRLYDDNLELFGRSNLAGPSQALHFLKDLDPSAYERCDYLWNKGYFQTLLIELWRLHERQINQLCKAEFHKEWHVPAKEIDVFFEDPKFVTDGSALFAATFQVSWHGALGVEPHIHKEWLLARNQLLLGRTSIQVTKLEEGCLYLCAVSAALGKWGRARAGLQYDGISHLELEEVDETADFSRNHWQEFKAEQLTGHQD